MLENIFYNSISYITVATGASGLDKLAALIITYFNIFSSFVIHPDEGPGHN